MILDSPVYFFLFVWLSLLGLANLSLLRVTRAQHAQNVPNEKYFFSYLCVPIWRNYTWRNVFGLDLDFQDIYAATVFVINRNHTHADWT